MARLRFPGRPGHRFERIGVRYAANDAKKDLDPSLQLIANIHKGLRYFRELFGDSDQEDDEFLGFSERDIQKAEKKLISAKSELLELENLAWRSIKSSGYLSKKSQSQRLVDRLCHEGLTRPAKDSFITKIYKSEKKKEKAAKLKEKRKKSKEGDEMRGTSKLKSIKIRLVGDGKDGKIVRGRGRPSIYDKIDEGNFVTESFFSLNPDFQKLPACERRRIKKNERRRKRRRELKILEKEQKRHAKQNTNTCTSKEKKQKLFETKHKKVISGVPPMKKMGTNVMAKQLLTKAKFAGRKPEIPNHETVKSVRSAPRSRNQRQFIIPSVSSRSARKIKPNKRFLDDSLNLYSAVKSAPLVDVTGNEETSFCLEETCSDVSSVYENDVEIAENDVEIEENNLEIAETYPSTASTAPKLDFVPPPPIDRKIGLFEQPLILPGKRDRKPSMKLIMKLTDEDSVSKELQNSQETVRCPSPAYITYAGHMSAKNRRALRRSKGKLLVRSDIRTKTVVQKAKFRLNQAALNRSKAALAKSLKREMKKEEATCKQSFALPPEMPTEQLSPKSLSEANSHHPQFGSPMPLTSPTSPIKIGIKKQTVKFGASSLPQVPTFTLNSTTAQLPTFQSPQLKAQVEQKKAVIEKKLELSPTKNSYYKLLQEGGCEICGDPEVLQFKMMGHECCQSCRRFYKAFSLRFQLGQMKTSDKFCEREGVCEVNLQKKCGSCVACRFKRCRSVFKCLFPLKGMKAYDKTQCKESKPSNEVSDTCVQNIDEHEQLTDKCDFITSTSNEDLVNEVEKTVFVPDPEKEKRHVSKLSKIKPMKSMEKTDTGKPRRKSGSKQRKEEQIEIEMAPLEVSIPDIVSSEQTEEEEDARAEILRQLSEEMQARTSKKSVEPSNQSIADKAEVNEVSSENELVLDMPESSEDEEKVAETSEPIWDEQNESALPELVQPTESSPDTSTLTVSPCSSGDLSGLQHSPRPRTSPQDGVSVPSLRHGPRIKHVCRRASVALGKTAVFSEAPLLRLSALPSDEKEILLQKKSNKRDSSSDSDDMSIDEIIKQARHEKEDVVTVKRTPNKAFPALTPKARSKQQSIKLNEITNKDLYAKGYRKLGRTMRCKKCEACLRENCGKCNSCSDMIKYGGRGVNKKACVKRVCLKPLAWRRKNEYVSEVNEIPDKFSKKSVFAQRKIEHARSNLRQKQRRIAEEEEASDQEKMSAPKKKLKNKVSSVAGKPVRLPTRRLFTSAPQKKPISPSAGSAKRRQKFPSAIPVNHTIKADYKEDFDIDVAWQHGVPLLSSGPLCVRSVCFLCGSAGKQQLLYCSVCCEPFHSFCLEESERPLEENLENWCCRRCQFCRVCGQQHNLLQCDKCQETYHPECLGPNYPTGPSRRKNIWICTKCVRCKSCGATTPGKTKDATWMYDFQLCNACGILMDKGNYCPVCHKCYTDDDWESKMIQCGQCDSWVHARCEELTDEMYNIMSYLPEDVPFYCRICSPERPAPWETMLQNEMKSGFQIILDTLLSAKCSLHLEPISDEVRPIHKCSDDGKKRKITQESKEIEKPSSHKSLGEGRITRRQTALLEHTECPHQDDINKDKKLVPDKKRDVANFSDESECLHKFCDDIKCDKKQPESNVNSEKHCESESFDNVINHLGSKTSTDNTEKKCSEEINKSKLKDNVLKNKTLLLSPGAFMPESDGTGNTTEDVSMELPEGLELTEGDSLIVVPEGTSILGKQSKEVEKNISKLGLTDECENRIISNEDESGRDNMRNGEMIERGKPVTEHLMSSNSVNKSRDDNCDTLSIVAPLSTSSSAITSPLISPFSETGTVGSRGSETDTASETTAVEKSINTGFPVPDKHSAEAHSLREKLSRLSDSKPLPDSPCHLKAIRIKMDEKGYTSVNEFLDDIVRIIRFNLNIPDLPMNRLKSYEATRNIFLKHVERCFPWYNVKKTHLWKYGTDLPQGMLPHAVLPPSDDHTYAQWMPREGSTSSPQPSPFKRLPNTPFKSARLLEAEILCGTPVMSFAEDLRRCSLCCQIGDSNADEMGRLLYVGHDDWVHINCALWSAEVYEEVDGTLQNVHAAIGRARTLKCDYCNKNGATVGCCQRGCPANYHFPCARHALCIFQQDRKVFCPIDNLAVDGKLVQGGKFSVSRRGCIEKSGVTKASKKNWQKGLKASSVNILIGSMTVDKLGRICQLSDTPDVIYPVDYCVTRIYWSTFDARRRCVYTCRIKIVHPQRLSSPAPTRDMTIPHDSSHPDYNPALASSYVVKPPRRQQPSDRSINLSLSLEMHHGFDSSVSSADYSAYASYQKNTRARSADDVFNSSFHSQTSYDSYSSSSPLGHTLPGKRQRRRSFDICSLSERTRKFIGAAQLAKYTSKIQEEEENTDDLRLSQVVNRLNQAAACNRSKKLKRSRSQEPPDSRMTMASPPPQRIDEEEIHLQTTNHSKVSSTLVKGNTVFCLNTQSTSDTIRRRSTEHRGFEEVTPVHPLGGKNLMNMKKVISAKIDNIAQTVISSDQSGDEQDLMRLESNQAGITAGKALSLVKPPKSQSAVVCVDITSDEDLSDIDCAGQLDGVDDRLSQKPGPSAHAGDPNIPLRDQIVQKIKAESLARSIVSEEGPYKCPKCKRLYRTKQSCDKHSQTCDFEVSTSEEEEEGEFSEEEKRKYPLRSSLRNIEEKIDLSAKNTLKSYPLRSSCSGKELSSPESNISAAQARKRNLKSKSSTNPLSITQTKRSRSSSVTSPVEAHRNIFDTLSSGMSMQGMKMKQLSVKLHPLEPADIELCTSPSGESSSQHTDEVIATNKPLSTSPPETTQMQQVGEKRMTRSNSSALNPTECEVNRNEKQHSTSTTTCQKTTQQQQHSTGTTTCQKTTQQHSAGTTTSQKTTQQQQHTTGTTTCQKTTQQHSAGTTTCQKTTQQQQNSTGTTTCQKTTQQQQHSTGTTTCQKTTQEQQHSTGTTTCQKTTQEQQHSTMENTVISKSESESSCTSVSSVDRATSSQKHQLNTEVVVRLKRPTGVMQMPIKVCSGETVEKSLQQLDVLSQHNAKQQLKNKTIAAGSRQCLSKADTFCETKQQTFVTSSCAPSSPSNANVCVASIAKSNPTMTIALPSVSSVTAASSKVNVITLPSRSLNNSSAKLRQNVSTLPKQAVTRQSAHIRPSHIIRITTPQAKVHAQQRPLPQASGSALNCKTASVAPTFVRCTPVSVCSTTNVPRQPRLSPIRPKPTESPTTVSTSSVETVACPTMEVISPQTVEVIPSTLPTSSPSKLSTLMAKPATAIPLYTTTVTSPATSSIFSSMSGKQVKVASVSPWQQTPTSHSTATQPSTSSQISSMGMVGGPSQPLLQTLPENAQNNIQQMAGGHLPFSGLSSTAQNLLSPVRHVVNIQQAQNMTVVNNVVNVVTPSTLGTHVQASTMSLGPTVVSIAGTQLSCVNSINISGSQLGLVSGQQLVQPCVSPNQVVGQTGYSINQPTLVSPLSSPTQTTTPSMIQMLPAQGQVVVQSVHNVSPPMLGMAGIQCAATASSSQTLISQEPLNRATSLQSPTASGFQSDKLHTKHCTTKLNKTPKIYPAISKCVPVSTSPPVQTVTGAAKSSRVYVRKVQASNIQQAPAINRSVIDSNQKMFISGKHVSVDKGTGGSGQQNTVEMREKTILRVEQGNSATATTRTINRVSRVVKRIPSHQSLPVRPSLSSVEPPILMPPISLQGAPVRPALKIMQRKDCAAIVTKQTPISSGNIIVNKSSILENDFVSGGVRATTHLSLKRRLDRGKELKEVKRMKLLADSVKASSSKTVPNIITTESSAPQHKTTKGDTSQSVSQVSASHYTQEKTRTSPDCTSQQTSVALFKAHMQNIVSKSQKSITKTLSEQMTGCKQGALYPAKRHKETAAGLSTAKHHKQAGGQIKNLPDQISKELRRKPDSKASRKKKHRKSVHQPRNYEDSSSSIAHPLLHSQRKHPFLPEAAVEEEVTESPLCPGGRHPSDRHSSQSSKYAPYLVFEITSDDGFRVQSKDINEAWKSITDKVQDARINAHMKQLSYDGVEGLRMFGLTQTTVVYLLEQLYGAENCRSYSFKHHKYELPELEEEEEVNPTGCARSEPFHTRKPYDTFSFLLSQYRLRPSCESKVAAEKFIHKSQRRATSMELPMAMRFRHLRSHAKEAVGAYMSDIHGRGLYCKRNIDAGEMVIEYAGEVIRSSLTDYRERYYESKGIGCYMFRLDDMDVVDATMKGNAARFINHSCEPNCYSKVITVDGKKHIVIFALEVIKRGEELTYDYKFPIEDVKIPCNCNSKRCRRYLN